MTDKELSVPSSDLLALVAFLAGRVDELYRLRDVLMGKSPNECVDGLIMKWPTIQGTRNQMNIAAIGKLPWSSEQVTRAVAGILKANNPLRGDHER
jgi:hypothetical protein